MDHEAIFAQIEYFVAWVVRTQCEKHGWPWSEDIRQEGMLSGWRAILSWQPDKSCIQSWVSLRVAGAVTDYVRRQSPLSRYEYRKRISSGEPMPVTVPLDDNHVPSIAAADALAASESRADLRNRCGRAWSALSPRRRSQIIKKFWLGYFGTEIAESEGCSESRVYHMLEESLIRLRKNLPVRPSLPPNRAGQVSARSFSAGAQ